jgi:hypothetical protein
MYTDELFENRKKSSEVTLHQFLSNLKADKCENFTSLSLQKADVLFDFVNALRTYQGQLISQLRINARGLSLQDEEIKPLLEAISKNPAKFPELWLDLSDNQLTDQTMSVLTDLINSKKCPTGFCMKLTDNTTTDSAYNNVADAIFHDPNVAGMIADREQDETPRIKINFCTQRYLLIRKFPEYQKHIILMFDDFNDELNLFPKSSKDKYIHLFSPKFFDHSYDYLFEKIPEKLIQQFENIKDQITRSTHYKSVGFSVS